MIVLVETKMVVAVTVAVLTNSSGSSNSSSGVSCFAERNGIVRCRKCWISFCTKTNSERGKKKLRKERILFWLQMPLYFIFFNDYLNFCVAFFTGRSNLHRWARDNTHISIKRICLERETCILLWISRQKKLYTVKILSL